MSQPIVFLLLILALVLPVIGAAALRLLAPRLDARQFFGGAALLLAIAMASVLVLSRSNVDSLRIGNLTLLLPLSAPAADELDLPPEIEELLRETPVVSDTTQPDLQVSPTLALTPTSELTPTATMQPSATLTPTVELTPTATIAPTATLTPTIELPTATPEPPPAEPAATPEPPAPQPRTYTVQPGDTLRGIAEQFNVSVADLLRVNNLTAEQADALRVGTVLTIP